jgi:hypothetical protein
MASVGVDHDRCRYRRKEALPAAPESVGIPVLAAIICASEMEEVHEAA